VAERVQPDAFPQEIFSLRKGCISHRIYGVSVDAKGTVIASAAECLRLLIPLFKIFPEDFSGG